MAASSLSFQKTTILVSDLTVHAITFCVQIGLGLNINCCSKYGNLCVSSYRSQGCRKVRRADAMQEVATSDTLKTDTKA
jgi:hypothetical protein